MNVGDILLDDGELEHILKLHKQSGFDYLLPDFPDNPRFPIQLSIRHQGELLAAALVKIEAEVYLFVDHDAATPKDRKAALEMLHNDLVKRARIMGFDQLYAVLPPQVEKSFGPRLIEAGWRKDRGWSKYTYELLK